LNSLDGVVGIELLTEWYVLVGQERKRVSMSKTENRRQDTTTKTARTR